MIKIVTVEQMQAIEQAADEGGLSYDEMMQNAGRGLAEVIKQFMDSQNVEQRVAFLIGKGNNGGDGLVAARLLKEETDVQVGCYLLEPRAEDDAIFTATRDAGVFLADAVNDQRYRILRTLVENADILVDAVLGTGTQLPLNDEVAKFLKQAAGALRTEPVYDPMLTWPTDVSMSVAPKTLVIAADCPSGLDCDTGEIAPEAIPADLTVTFAAAKRGHMLFPGAASVGDLVIVDIGISPRLEPLANVELEMLTGRAVREMLPRRSRDGHKGSFGTVGVIAGSVNYTGAAALAGEAAYRAGAGLVRMAVPTSIYPILAGQLREAVWLMLPHEMGVIRSSAVEVFRKEAGEMDALLIGPGLGREDETAQFISDLLLGSEKAARKPRGRIGFSAQADPSGAATNQESAFTLPQKLVIDADGLNLLAEMEKWHESLPQQTVLTPHPGEMARLTGLDRDDVLADRLGLAKTKAAEWGATVVLKGAFTVVASPDGRVAVAPYATDALATAGTGDVLAGIIVGLMSQGADAFEAAAAATYLHGSAGEMAELILGPRSVLASDVLTYITDAFSNL
ncbi:MAG: bifunctional ADP-dependent NAD(P)H-hydrate dehydratase/NAD(P)H-hydrate epimerase [Chloroflexi bacterium]|nr:bifunctional ADP-dependent NAD(P)H-hydrate dehydratase/NAD(P)H-hydrate epimerase [Chloroflexota bacterium]